MPKIFEGFLPALLSNPPPPTLLGPAKNFGMCVCVAAFCMCRSSGRLGRALNSLFDRMEGYEEHLASTHDLLCQLLPVQGVCMRMVSFPLNLLVLCKPSLLKVSFAGLQCPYSTAAQTRPGTVIRAVSAPKSKKKLHLWKYLTHLALFLSVLGSFVSGPIVPQSALRRSPT